MRTLVALTHVLAVSLTPQPGGLAKRLNKTNKIRCIRVHLSPLPWWCQLWARLLLVSSRNRTSTTVSFLFGVTRVPVAPVLRLQFFVFPKMSILSTSKLMPDTSRDRKHIDAMPVHAVASPSSVIFGIRRRCVSGAGRAEPDSD